ncbi:MAG TPA: class I SAM-dependent methyltransferase [Candidatus Acidoferrum sp.]|jgi:SAM-dependent methyltransferase|nr:class I SAM-dependent methyltransferase [Candidatus Acidoferrum sp.]
MSEQKALYDSFIADYYDSSPMVTQRTQDVAFYCIAARKYGDPILELGCGTGRITLAIAEAGYRVVGLDISEKMLEHAVEKRAGLRREARERVHLVQGDMTKFDLGEKFRTVVIPFRPFQHLLETEQQMSCLNSVHKHLAPNGRIIVDFFQTDPERMHDPRFLNESALIEYDLPGGRHVVLSERVAAFHRALQRNDVEMIFDVKHPDGKQERLVMAWTLRYFFRYEVEHLLARCGFRLEATYGNFDSSPLANNSPEMIFVATVG